MTLINERRLDAIELITIGLDATELGFLDGALAGTQVASKCVVADANVNSGVSKVTALHIGVSGSETEVTATGAELNFLDIASLGTGASSKAVVLDSGEDYTWPAAGVLTYGVLADASTTLGATVDELNRSADLSARLVGLTATLSITEVLHEGRDLFVTGTALATYTLPEATGGGARYKFIIGEVNTNNTVIVVADTTNTNYIGSVNNLDLDASAQAAFGSPANSDTITLNGTTTGGALGDFIELVDVATDVWMVFGQLQTPTGSNPATPFSAAV